MPALLAVLAVAVTLLPTPGAPGAVQERTIRGSHQPLALLGLVVGSHIRVSAKAAHVGGRPVGQAAPTSVVRKIAVAVSTFGKDSSCTRGVHPAPCASFGRAYQLARCGDIIGVEPGSYPAQRIGYDGRKTCTNAAVLLRPSRGTVSVRSPDCTPRPNQCTALVLGNDVTDVGAPSGLTVRGIRIRGDVEVYGNGGSQGDHLTLDHITGGGGVVSDATHFVLSNSRMGGCQNDDYSPHKTPCDNNFIFASQDDGYATTARLVHDTFHDFTKRTVDSHFECLFILDVTTVVVEDSRFYNCMEAGIQLEYRETPRSVLIQNNWFGQTSDENGDSRECNAIRLSSNDGSQTNTLIRYNSFAHGQGVISSSGTPTSGVRMIGNLFGLDPTADCATGRVGFSGAVYDSNVWERHRYGGNSRTVSNISRLYVNGSDLAQGNYHLIRHKTVADGLVNRTSADYKLLRDRDGHRRTGPWNAGADQRTPAQRRR